MKQSFWAASRSSWINQLAQFIVLPSWLPRSVTAEIVAGFVHCKLQVEAWRWGRQSDLGLIFLRSTPMPAWSTSRCPRHPQFCLQAGTRLDISAPCMTLIPWKAGKPVMWDVTSTSTTAASYVDSSSRKTGDAAEFAASCQTAKCTSLIPQHLLYPVLQLLSKLWAHWMKTHIYYSLTSVDAFRQYLATSTRSIFCASAAF